jgi:hypothetical protein
MGIPTCHTQTFGSFCGHQRNQSNSTRTGNEISAPAPFIAPALTLKQGRGGTERNEEAYFNPLTKYKSSSTRW